MCPGVTRSWGTRAELVAAAGDCSALVEHSAAVHDSMQCKVTMMLVGADGNLHRSASLKHWRCRVAEEKSFHVPAQFNCAPTQGVNTHNESSPHGHPCTMPYSKNVRVRGFTKLRNTRWHQPSRISSKATTTINILVSQQNSTDPARKRKINRLSESSFRTYKR